MTFAPILNLLGFETDGKRLAKASVRIGITVYPHDNDPVFTERKSRARRFNWIKGDTEGSVVGFNWSKRLGASAGTWSATIKLARDTDIDPAARGDILDGDWVDIEVNRNGYIFQICRGVVDSVRLHKSGSIGATIRTLTLTGRDHGAPFDGLTAWQNIYVRTLTEVSVGLYTDRVGGAPGDSPGGMFRRLIEATFARGTEKNRSAWHFPPSIAKTSESSFIDELSIITGDTRGFFMNQDQLWTGPGQTLHQTLQNWCNPLLNEIIYDFNPVAPVGKEMEARIREKPFVSTVNGRNSPWFNLDTLTIPDWMFTEDDLVRAGHERFNIFEVMADLGYMKGQEQTGMTPPIYAMESVKRHGLKPYTENTKYIAAGGDGSWELERKDWQRLLVDWYGPNPYLLSGTASIGAMIPEVQLGKRLRVDTGETARDLTAYVEAVEHSFRWAGPSGPPDTATNVTVTRGWHGSDDDYLRMVQAVSAQYQDNF